MGKKKRGNSAVIERRAGKKTGYTGPKKRSFEKSGAQNRIKRGNWAKKNVQVLRKHICWERKTVEKGLEGPTGGEEGKPSGSGIV